MQNQIIVILQCYLYDYLQLEVTGKAGYFNRAPLHPCRGVKVMQRVYNKEMLLRRKHISVTIVTDIFNKNFKFVIQFCLNYNISQNLLKFSWFLCFFAVKLNV